MLGCEANPTSLVAPTATSNGVLAAKQEEVLVVTIVEGKKYPKFYAKIGSDVLFLYPEHPDAVIEFYGGSPFARKEFPVGTPQKVKGPIGEYHYYVETYTGAGSGEILEGNGSGEIIP
jgi:hypothetical protein